MAATDDDVRIVRAGVERLDDLEPLTRSLHAHQLTVDPAIPGIMPRDEDGWWRIRRERYRAWLTSEEGSFALIAETGDGIPVGYAVVTIHDEDDSHATGDRFAELRSLAVLPSHRGAGLGTRLLHRVYREVHALGIAEMVIGVLATNEAALRLYEREGFRPWVVLTMGKVPAPSDQDPLQA